ncbi:MAG: FAD-dependent oxidoreductase [Thermodesulfobacteriota bacterium]
MKFIVIGGDAAGMSAASRAKRKNPDVEVTVLEKTRDVSYSACGMPYNIADRTRPIEDLVVRRAEVFREKQGIHLLTGHRVESIDIEGKTVNGISDQEKPAVALHTRMTVQEFSQTDLAYAPPFGPVWDPLLTASHQLLKIL